MQNNKKQWVKKIVDIFTYSQNKENFVKTMAENTNKKYDKENLEALFNELVKYSSKKTLSTFQGEPKKTEYKLSTKTGFFYSIGGFFYGLLKAVKLVKGTSTKEKRSKAKKIIEGFITKNSLENVKIPGVLLEFGVEQNLEERPVNNNYNENNQGQRTQDKNNVQPNIFNEKNSGQKHEPNHRGNLPQKGIMKKNHTSDQKGNDKDNQKTQNEKNVEEKSLRDSNAKTTMEGAHTKNLKQRRSMNGNERSI